MISIIACLIGVFGLLIIAELLGKNYVLKGEYHRKFLHITAGSFMAFWPWLMSWRWIEALGLLMILVMLANRYISFLNYRGRIGRATHGDILLALAIFLVAIFAPNRLFFAIAILEVALADGLAAIAGITFGQDMKYTVFKNKKTVLGSAIFLITSFIIFYFGLRSDSINFAHHNLILAYTAVPLLLTLLENISTFGLDNLTVPLVAVFALSFLQL